MPRRAHTVPTDNHLSLDEIIPALKQGTRAVIRVSSDFGVGISRVYLALLPLINLINRQDEVSETELHAAFDGLFQALAKHPAVGQLRDLTTRMRSQNLLPNEQSTEELIHYLVTQLQKRSVVNIPQELTDEFWRFFNELMSAPELRGLGDISLDVTRILVTAYEPLLAQLINQLKNLRRVNDEKLRAILANARVVRSDLLIFKRQIRALRHVRSFFDTDPRDFTAQAGIVAQMVREFGPLFIKMAQVAAANSDFLPQEISAALAVFRDDVQPMNAEEVNQAFIESFGELPGDRYFGFDASQPLKSGSIASVYLAQKPFSTGTAQQLLVPVVIKVGRHNLEREFLIGKTVIKLAILSSQYWAPHSKLAPFFSSWLDQIDEFVEGFRRELDFESEAESQSRFAQRIRYSDGWRVPRVYTRTRRIIEMEFIDRAASLNCAFAGMHLDQSRVYRRRLGRAFLHAVLSQLLIHREFHGDLHPGNVLVKDRKHLYFVDWGNTINLKDIWRPALQYFRAVLLGDAVAVTQAVIRMSAESTAVATNRDELRGVIEAVFATAEVEPLRLDFALTLYREGQQGLINRLQLAMQLASGMTRQGVVIKSEYLHLCRSLAAMMGSYLGLYQGLSRFDLWRDIAQVLVQFPAQEGLGYALGVRTKLLQRLKAQSHITT